MGGESCEPPYVVPHPCCFQVEGCQPLEQLERALAKKGLCDPWIRNEVWRFHPGFGSRWMRFRAAVFRGAPLGAALALATAIATRMMDSHSHHHDPCDSCPAHHEEHPPKEDCPGKRGANNKAACGEGPCTR